jgi:hypothetical protein
MDFREFFFHEVRALSRDVSGTSQKNASVSSVGLSASGGVGVRGASIRLA